ncbi:flagellar basal body-associated FliL family protein [Paenibacillus humicola]|uniref:flagellar basal body-associated FliL family protein n=1 Tax=Paenibacillus humicola TaxID=3110540 RepID=UPI00237BAAC6|nr:flagellar basal body-associated FliL family protein [Paenibacillus humicola]
MRRMLPWLMTILLAITLIAVVAVILYKSMLGGDDPKNAADKAAGEAASVKAEQLSADERVALTSELSDIKTNLADTDYIAVLSLAFQLDKKSTKADFDKIKDIQITPIILRTLADLKPEDIKGSHGQDELCAKLLNLINPVLTDGGKLVNVELTNLIVTPL